DRLTLRDGLSRELGPDVGADVPPDAEVLGQRHRDRLGGLDFGFLDAHAIVDADLGLAAELAVDADHALSLIVGVAGPDARDGATLATLDQDVIAVFEVEVVHRRAVDRRQSAPGVLLF